MRRIRLAGAASTVVLALALGACGGGGSEGTTDGEFREEDPTLTEEGDSDTGNSTESNQPSDNGSGTGSGRGDE